MKQILAIGRRTCMIVTSMICIKRIQEIEREKKKVGGREGGGGL